jgi:MtN3 and saliva related transmembrane protein
VKKTQKNTLGREIAMLTTTERLKRIIDWLFFCSKEAFMDRIKGITTWLFGCGLVANALIFVPQLFLIWTTKQIEGISVVTFGTFCLVQLIGTLHGILQKDKAVAIGMGTSLITCGATTLSVIYLRYIA